MKGGNGLRKNEEVDAGLDDACVTDVCLWRSVMI